MGRFTVWLPKKNRKHPDFSRASLRGTFISVDSFKEVYNFKV